jgi:hypothetical protein
MLDERPVQLVAGHGDGVHMAFAKLRRRLQQLTLRDG